MANSLGGPVEMKLEAPLGPDEPGPIEHGGTQFDERRIHGPQRILEPEPPAFEGGHSLTPGDHLVEEGLV